MVTVVSAREIAAADPGGMSDPYVTVKLNEKKHKTATKKNMKGEAEWGEKFEWHKARAASYPSCRYPTCSLATYIGVTAGGRVRRCT